MKAVKKYISLLISLKALILAALLVPGIDLSLTNSLFANSDTGVHLPADYDDTVEILVVDTTFGDDRQWPKIPEESSSSKEEEERVDDDKTEENSTESSFTGSTDFSLSGYTLPASKASSYYLGHLSYRLSVPLYILFHSWKNFLV